MAKSVQEILECGGLAECEVRDWERCKNCTITHARAGSDKKILPRGIVSENHSSLGAASCVLDPGECEFPPVVQEDKGSLFGYSGPFKLELEGV